MAYERDSPYARVFDATQSPVYLDMLAGRFGVKRDQPAEGKRRVYLDLGCAQGHTIIALAPLYPDIDFIGVDFNPQHISTGREEVERLGLDNVRLVEADFCDLPADLPLADYIIVRGIYSWLAPDVKAALERVCGQLTAPGGLLKLHASVRPGAMLRESAMGLLRSILGTERVPDDGRQLLSLLAREAEPLNRTFVEASKGLEAMVQERDELWLHDLFNVDFQSEHVDAIIKRFNGQGFRYLAASAHEQNLPAITVSEPIWQRMQNLDFAAAQSLFDMATASGLRDDVYVREPFEQRQADYASALRFGLIVPESKAREPYQTVRGQVHFERQDCQQILQVLLQQPLSWMDLNAALPHLGETTVGFWLDLLIAAKRVGPFPSAEHVALIDRDRLCQLNRERIAHAMESFSSLTSTPLLAAEYGNCLVAGWFETLVLDVFEDRHLASIQEQMLKRIHGAGIAFTDPDSGSPSGNVSPNQLDSLRKEMLKLEQSYLVKMGYWGIGVLI